MDRSSGGGSGPAVGGSAKAEATQNDPLIATKRRRCRCPVYFRSPLGVLKVVEAALSVAALICALIQLDSVGGWGSFVASSSLVTCSFLLLLHATGLDVRLPCNVPFTEFVIAIIHVTFFLTSGIVCSAKGLAPQYAAYAFFGFAACLAYAVDAVVQSRVLRSGGAGFRCRKEPAHTTQPLPQQQPTEKN